MISAKPAPDANALFTKTCEIAMPVLGTAAMLLSFDVEDEAIDEHDRWHTQEHLPERLSIPGFNRGTRWIAAAGGPRYVVLYEVESLEIDA